MTVSAFKLAFEIGQSVRGPRDLDGSRPMQKGNAYAVVSSIFKLPETAQQNRSRVLFAQISENATHSYLSSTRVPVRIRGTYEQAACPRGPPAPQPHGRLAWFSRRLALSTMIVLSFPLLM